MAEVSSDRELLENRILLALADDEEYPEEIYTFINFDLIENIRTKRLYYRVYVRVFRLADVLEVVEQLVRRGLVTFRDREGYDPCCGMISKMYRLTDAGKERLRECVLPIRDELFD